MLANQPNRPLVCLTIVAVLWGQLAPPLFAQGPSPSTAADFLTDLDDVDRLSAVRATPFPDEVMEQIDPRTGSLLHSVIDLQIEAGTTALTVQRYRRLEPGLPGLLGSDWRLNWEKRALRNKKIAVIEEGVGITIFQREQTSGKQLYRAANGDSLVFSSGNAVRTVADGTEESFDGSGRLVERLEPDGTRINLVYDRQGRLTRVNGPFGCYLRFFLDSHGRLEHAQSSSGAMVQYLFEDFEDTAATDAITDPATLRYSYDDFGRLTSITHPQRGESQIEYDDLGRVIGRQWPDRAVEKYEYDGNRVRYTDAAGFDTVIRFSEDGRQIESVDPLGHHRMAEFDEAGRITRITGPRDASSRLHYDPVGRLTRVVNPNTGTLELGYSGERRIPSEMTEQGVRTRIQLDEGRLTGVSVEDETEAPLRMEYDERGLLRSVIEGETTQRQFKYDTLGRAVEITNANGASVRLQYDRLGNVVRETDARGNEHQFTYDQYGRLILETKPLGERTSYQYGETGLLQRITWPGGGTTLYSYDARGRVADVTDPVGRTLKYEYSPRGRVVAEQQAKGALARYKYDGNGNLIGLTNALGGVSQWSYDELGAWTSARSAIGLATNRRYDNRGLLAEQRFPDGTWLRYEYDQRGRQITTEDDRGVKVSFEWSPGGRLLGISPENRPRLSFGYDAAGNLVELKSGEQPLAAMRYDVESRPTEWTQPNGRIDRYVWDANDNLVAWQDNRGAKRFIEYDANDRPVRVRDSFGRVTELRYNQAGNLVETIDAAGNISRRRYTLADELKEFTAPNGGRVTCEYDQVGLVAAITRADGVTARYEYDRMANVVRSRDPARGECRYEFDQAGRLTRQTDARGLVTEFRYDAHGHLASKTLGDGTEIRYRYDRDRLIEVDDGKFPVRYEYDDWGNRTKIYYPAIKKMLTYHYDDRDRVVGFEDGTGRTIHYEHDQADRITKLQFDDGKAINFTHDTLQREEGVVLPNGIRGVYRFDSEDRVEELNWSRNGKMMASWRHEYNAAGFRTKTIDQDGEEVKYRHDASGQLLEEKDQRRTTQYAYGPGGHRRRIVAESSETAYEYNESGQLVRAGEEAFAYDAGGNLTSRVGPEGKTTYTYDAENRLVKVELPSGASVEYGYAPTGERVWRQDDQGRTYYLCDGFHVVAELDEEFATVTRYVHGPSIDRPLVMSRDEQDFYMLADAQGSIRRCTDAAGETVAQRRFDAFGNLLNEEAPTGLFSFSGREFDQVTGLYYFRARWYAPELGRFLTPDPVSGRVDHPVSLNPYVFALNRPQQVRDPLGTNPDDEYIRALLGQLSGLSPAQQLSRLKTEIYTAETLILNRQDPLGRGFEGHWARTIEQERKSLESMRRMANRVKKGLPPVKAAQMPPPPNAPKPPTQTARIQKPGTPTPPPDPHATGKVPRATPDPSSQRSGAGRASGGSGKRLPKGYKPGGGGAFGTFAPPEPKPSLWNRIKNLFASGKGSGSAGQAARQTTSQTLMRSAGPVLMAAAFIHAGYNVATADPNHRGHVAATEGGGLLGGTLGASLGALLGAGATLAFGLTPLGWGSAAVGITGMVIGGLGGNYAGRAAGGQLVPPGAEGGDAIDFIDPTVGTGQPAPEPQVELPGIDPDDFVPPQVDPARAGGGQTVYHVIYQCTICMKVHDGGYFSDPARAQLAAQRYQVEGYRVSIVPRTAPQ